MNITEYGWWRLPSGVGFKDIPIEYDIYTDFRRLIDMGHLVAGVTVGSDLGVRFTIDWSKS